MIEIFENIPFRLDPDQILKSLGSPRVNSHLEKVVENMVSLATALGRPKALYRVSQVVGQGWDTVEIDQIRFKSRVLRVNLAAVSTVFPYVVTSGRELDTIETSEENIVDRYVLDAIKRFVLLSAIGFLSAYLKKKYSLKKAAHMNPGSLEDWPITQQGGLFSLLGNVEQLIGVKLMESYMMQPLKSSSGIYFASDADFQSCHLCSRKKCSGRRVSYDESMVQKYNLVSTTPINGY